MTRWRCPVHDVLWTTWTDDEPVECWYRELTGEECDGAEPVKELPLWAQYQGFMP